MSRTADDLVSAIKSTGIIPESQSLVSSARMLAFADEETMNDLLPTIDSINQEFFVVTESDPIVAGQESYSIPYRAVGRKLRDLKLSDGSTIRSLTKIALEDAHYYNFSASPAGFYLMGDKIIVVPRPSVSGYTLIKYYLFRPGRLALTSSCGLVSGISGNIITLTATPSVFTSGTTIDFIRGKSGYDTISFDKTITNVSGTQITVSAAPSDLAVGDWVSVAETTPVIQFPDECFSYLVMRTTKRILEALGDFEGANSMNEQIKQTKRNMQMMFDPRNEGASTKIIQRNGLLRAYRQLRYYRGITS